MILIIGRCILGGDSPYNESDIFFEMSNFEAIFFSVLAVAVIGLFFYKKYKVQLTNE
ncbi:MAG: hypothetical protein ACI857_002543 [Arenicella sp.]|jgi:hypothetical protein